MESAVLDTGEPQLQENEQPTVKLKETPVQVDFDLQGPEANSQEPSDDEIN